MFDKYVRIAAVIGDTSGIGEATARKFIGAGFGVVGNGCNVEKLALLEKEFGPAFCGVAGDAVTQPPHVHISDIIVRPTRQDYP